MDDFQGKAIVFFDGRCNLCSRFVNFILPRDRGKKFLYAPLQGATARRLLDKEDWESLKSIILFKDGQAIKEARAVAEVLMILYPRWAKFLKIPPYGFYNIFYRFIAKRRYSIMGKKSHLYQPAKEQRELFLP